MFLLAWAVIQEQRFVGDFWFLMQLGQKIALAADFSVVMAAAERLFLAALAAEVAAVEVEFLLLALFLDLAHDMALVCSHAL